MAINRQEFCKALRNPRNWSTISFVVRVFNGLFVALLLLRLVTALLIWSVTISYTAAAGQQDGEDTAERQQSVILKRVIPTLMAEILLVSIGSFVAFTYSNKNKFPGVSIVTAGYLIYTVFDDYRNWLMDGVNILLASVLIAPQIYWLCEQESNSSSALHNTKRTLRRVLQIAVVLANMVSIGFIVYYFYQSLRSFQRSKNSTVEKSDNDEWAEYQQQFAISWERHLIKQMFADVIIFLFLCIATVGTIKLNLTAAAVGGLDAFILRHMFVSQVHGRGIPSQVSVGLALPLVYFLWVAWDIRQQPSVGSDEGVTTTNDDEDSYYDIDTTTGDPNDTTKEYQEEMDSTVQATKDCPNISTENALPWSLDSVQRAIIAANVLWSHVAFMNLCQNTLEIEEYVLYSIHIAATSMILPFANMWEAPKGVCLFLFICYFVLYACSLDPDFCLLSSLLAAPHVLYFYMKYYKQGRILEEVARPCSDHDVV